MSTILTAGRQLSWPVEAGNELNGYWVERVFRPDAAHLVKPLPDGPQQTLAALVSRRKQLVLMRTMEGNHLGVAHPRAHKSIKAVIKSLETQVRHIEVELAAHLKQHHADVSKLFG